MVLGLPKLPAIPEGAKVHRVLTVRTLNKEEEIMAERVLNALRWERRGSLGLQHGSPSSPSSLALVCFRFCVGSAVGALSIRPLCENSQPDVRRSC